MEAQTSPKFVSPKGMWVSKLVLRCISSVMALSIISLGASLVSDVSVGYFPFIILGPEAGAALVWEIAESICLGVRGGHRGIHPGANVAVDLLIWLALIGGAIVTALYSGRGYYSEGYYWHDGVIEENYGEVLNSSGRKVQALAGLAATLALLHFATFVIACYETNIRNRMAYAPRIIIVSQAYDPTTPLGPHSAQYQEIANNTLLYKHISEQHAPLYGAPPYDTIPPPPPAVYARSEKEKE